MSTPWCRPQRRLTASSKILLVIVAILISVVAALVAGILARVGGAGLSATIASGGVAFGGTLGLALAVQNALGLL